MIGLPRVCVFAAALAVTGCGLLDAYPTLPRPPRPGVADAGSRVAICYDTLVSSLDEVQAMAQQECSAGTDWYLQHCPLLLPARATFVCAPKK